MVVRPVTTTGVGADISGIKFLPTGMLLGSIPDYLRIRTDKQIFAPTLQAFTIRSVQNLIILPFI
jgi:hypothetical protein